MSKVVGTDKMRLVHDESDSAADMQASGICAQNWNRQYIKWAERVPIAVDPHANDEVKERLRRKLVQRQKQANCKSSRA